MRSSIYKSYIKRPLDIILSACGLIILSPVFLLLALLIVIDDPGPVFFKQKRIGKNKTYFWLYKISTVIKPGNFYRRKTTTYGII